MSNNLFEACNGCEDRFVGCHSYCKIYLSSKAQLEVIKARKKQLKLVSESITKWDYDKSAFWSMK